MLRVSESASVRPPLRDSGRLQPTVGQPVRSRSHSAMGACCGCVSATELAVDRNRPGVPWSKDELKAVADDPKGRAYGNPALLVPAPGVPVRARVISVYDGDTMTCVVFDPGSQQLRSVKVRMADYNAPEMRKPAGTHESAKEAGLRRSRAIACKEQLVAHALNKDVFLRIQGRGKYGRTVARAYETPEDARRDRNSINNALAVMPGCRHMDSKGRQVARSASKNRRG